MAASTLSLKDRYLSFKEANPKVRIRDAAQHLGVSEAELLNTSVGDNVVRLSGDFRELLKQIPSLGYVMALTRNESCVHERKGVYEKVSFNNHVGLVLGEDIDLRLFMSHWKYGFAVGGAMPSLQFFDQHGEAVHKIFLQENSHISAYNALVEQFAAPEQSASIDIQPPTALASPKPNETIDVEGFQKAWLALEDTHQFFPLLQKFGVAREQALTLAPEGYAQRLSIAQFKTMLQQVAARNIEIMIFVHSKGCIQIHTGLVNNIVPMGSWLNILDPAFNLHLREDHVAQAWLVKKPTTDGIVTSIELFDQHQQPIALFFGKRKPAQPELTSWRNLLQEL